MKWTFGRSEWTFGQKRVRSEWTFGQKRVRSEWTFGQKRERSDEDSSMMRSHATVIADTPGELVGDDDDSEPEYVVST